MQVSDDEKLAVLASSTLETVDFAFYNFVNETLNVSVSTNEGFKKVPIIWITAERAFHIKNEKEIRELDSQSLVYPLISIERTSTSKTKPSERPLPGNKFPYNDYKKGSVTIARQINKNKTRNFKNADSQRIFGQQTFRNVPSNKVVYQYISIPFPVYASMNYEVKIRSQYQQQINEMMLPFINYAGGWNYFTIQHEGFNYETFMNYENEYKSNSSNQSTEEKKYDAKFTFRVLGYTTSNGENQQTPTNVLRENAVVVRFPRERVILGEENELASKPNKSFRP